MIESIISSDFWLQILRFFIGSTILLSVAWLVDVSNLVGSFRNRAYVWKTAVFASLLFLFPMLNSLAPVQYLESFKQQTPSLSEDYISTLSVPVTLSGLNRRDSLPEAGLFDINQTVTSLSEAEPIVPILDESLSNLSDNFLPATNLLTTPGKQNIGVWLLLFWGGCALFALLRLGVAYCLGLRSLGQRRLINRNDPVFAVLQAVCRRAGVETLPKLTRSCQTATPLTLLGNEICLPEWVDQSLSHHELKSILAHEVGHVKNRDLSVLLGLQLLICVFFFQPLFFKARSRLLDIFEFLADESALEQCKNKNEVTETLINCADKVQLRQSTQWGFAMVGNTSRLKQRIQQLNAKRKETPRAPAIVSKLATIAVVVAVLLVLPIFKYDYAAELTSSADEDNKDLTTANSSRSFLGRVFGKANSGSHYRVSGDKHSWRWSEGKAEWEGELTFDYSGDLTIVALSNGGRFDYRSEQIDPQRRIRFDMDGSELETTYWLEGDEVTLDADGHQWLHSILVQLLRSTGIDAQRRVATLLEQGGADSVIDELSFIDSDHVNRIYNLRLFENSQLDQGQITRLLEVDRSVSSDLEMRLILTGLAETQSLSPTNQTHLLTVAESISSDLEMRILLSSIVESTEGSVDFTQKLLSATASISSDLQQRLALTKIMESAELNDVSWQLLSNATEFISSDLQLRLLVSEVIQQVNQSESSTLSLISSTASINSDLEHRLALSVIVEHGVMTDQNWESIINVSQQISSDLQARLLLQRFLQYGADSTLMTQLALEYLSTINSDLEMRIAITSIIEKGNMTEENWLTAIAQINEHISSKLERSIAFETMREYVPDDDSLKARLYESML